MREELVEIVLRVVEAIPPGRAVTYGMIACAVGTGPRVVGRIMHDWGGGVPWWRVVNVHGTFPTTVRGRGIIEWERRGYLTIRHAGRCYSGNVLSVRSGSMVSHEPSARMC